MISLSLPFPPECSNNVPTPPSWPFLNGVVNAGRFFAPFDLGVIPSPTPTRRSATGVDVAGVDWRGGCIGARSGVEEVDACALVGVAGGRNGLGTGRITEDGARKAAGRKGVEDEPLALVELATDG